MEIDLAKDRLETWKNIIKYVGKNKSTIKKYVNNYGFPLFKSPGGWPVLYKSLYHEWEMRANTKETK